MYCPVLTNTGGTRMSTITVKDGTTIYYKDWGMGPVITFSHGWPLNSDMWDGQMLFLAQKGFRVVAHDRRGMDDPARRGPGTTWTAMPMIWPPSSKRWISRTSRWWATRPAAVRWRATSDGTARSVWQRRFSSPRCRRSC